MVFWPLARTPFFLTLMSTQQAQAAVITKKERFNAVGQQARSTDFSRALHTCLFVIAKRSNIGLLGPFHGVNGIYAGIEGDVFPSSGIITIEHDNGNDLPDYEDSPIQHAGFKQQADLKAVSHFGDGEEVYEPEEDEQGDGRVVDQFFINQYQ